MPEALVRAYFGVTDAAEYLGTTERHVRELIYRRDIPYYKVGRLVRFRPTDLDNWMDRNRVESR